MKRSNNDEQSLQSSDPSRTGSQPVRAAELWEDVNLGIDQTRPTFFSAHVERKREMFDESGYKATGNGTLHKIVLKKPVQTEVQNSGCCSIG